MANNFLPFCQTNTGTNLLSQGDYAVAPDRTNGNQPGVASSKLVNKALRQSSAVVSQLAQLVENTTGNSVLDDGDLTALLDLLKQTFLPTGMIQMWPKAAAPSGWLLLQGATIGNAASGGTARANADTQALFTVLWTEYSNTLLPIQDSAGVATTRGANAAADFAANKRMPLLNWGGIFPKGVGSRVIGGITYTGATLGTAEGDTMQGHRHAPPSGAPNFVVTGSGSIPSGGGTIVGTSSATGDPTADGTNGTPRVGPQTKPANMTINFIIKL